MQWKKFFTGTAPAGQATGEEIINWDFPEVETPRPGVLWYAVVGGLFILLFASAIWTANYLFALILAMCAFILILQLFRPQVMVTAAIFEKGVAVDGKFYPYKSIEAFTLLYEPPAVKVLYLDFRSNLVAPLAIPLADINPLRLQDFLKTKLPENRAREEMDFGDLLGRALKIK